MITQVDRGGIDVEVGLIGRESMVGSLAVIGGRPLSFNSAIVQIGGELGHRKKMLEAIAACRRCPPQAPRTPCSARG